MPKAVLITLIAFCLILASCVTPKTGPPPVSKVQERDFDFYIRQGSLCLGRAEYREAREYLDKAISLNPKSERAYNLRGIASLNWGLTRSSRPAFPPLGRMYPSSI